MSIHINNEPLHNVTISKYLGMFIDSNLKWDDHILQRDPQNLCQNRYPQIPVLRSLRNIIPTHPTDTVIQIYNVIIQPHLDYGDAIYDSASQTSKNSLQKLQTRAARLITGHVLVQAGTSCSIN